MLTVDLSEQQQYVFLKLFVLLLFLQCCSTVSFSYDTLFFLFQCNVPCCMTQVPVAFSQNSNFFLCFFTVQQQQQQLPEDGTLNSTTRHIWVCHQSAKCSFVSILIWFHFARKCSPPLTAKFPACLRLRFMKCEHKIKLSSRLQDYRPQPSKLTCSF